MEVGIRELRSHFSAYLDQVRAGRELTVTDRGAAVARLVPLGERPLDQLVRRGLVELAAPSSRSRPQTRRRAKGSVSELVADQRA